MISNLLNGIKCGRPVCLYFKITVISQKGNFGRKFVRERWEIIPQITNEIKFYMKLSRNDPNLYYLWVPLIYITLSLITRYKPLTSITHFPSDR